ncbi:MAG: permease [Verrucomicrobia bacterium]|nr:permease [Verrucomicrobiota bacterium]
MSWFHFSWQNFWFSFLALAFEGLPFVLVGSLISGFIAAFVPSRVITRFLPKNRFLATLVSGLLGLIFPVCECGVVPVVRRLLDKGLPLSCGLTYMLASPIVNPLVAISTYAAFRGQHPELNTGIRLISGYLVAVVVGLAVSRLDPAHLLGGQAFPSRSSLSPRLQRTGRRRAALSIATLPDAPEAVRNVSLMQRVIGAIQLASDDFIDTAIYFMIGAAVASVFNTAVDQRIMLPLASSPILSVIAMMLIAGILTLCSTSDAFIAATFTTFPIPARMAFLVFGPMFDLKLLFLYSGLLKKRAVIALGVGLFIIVGVLCVAFLPAIYANLGS